MKLVSLDLKNFRQHTDTSVTFADGVTGIIGTNGAGKSTILEAIAWALYGAPAVRGTNDTIRSKAAEGGSKVNVALTFEMGGSIYKVARGLDGSGRSGNAVLEVDGKPLRSGMSEVSDAVGKLLGMDYRAFFTSFFTGQKQVEFMASLDGRARANAISRMLGYDRVTKARDQANEDRKGLHREIEGLERGLANPEELKERRKSAQARLADANTAQAAAELSQKSAQAVLDRLKPLKEVADQKSRRFQELSRRLELDRNDLARTSERYKQLKAEFTDLQSKQKELESLKPGVERFEQAGREYRELSQLQKHEGERQKLAGQVETMELELKKLEARQRQLADAPEKRTRAFAALAEAQALLTDAEKRLQQAREQQVAHEHSQQAHVKQLESQRDEIQARRAQIEEAGEEGACPTCERPLADELPTVIANFREQIARLSDQIDAALLETRRLLEEDGAAVAAQQASKDKVATEVEKLRAELAASDTRLAEYVSVREQVEVRTNEINSFRAQLAAIPGGFDQARFRELQKTGEELRPVRDKAIALQSALERLDPVTGEIDDLRALGIARKAEIAASEEALKELAFSSEEHEKLMREFEEASSAFNAALLALERQRGEVSIATAILTAAEREEEAYRTRIEELKTKRAERLHLQALAEALDKLRADLNDRIRPELEAIASELLSTMTDGRYSVLVIDENYQARIKDDGEIKEVISGGEDDIVNLALRLAISQMIADRAGQSFSLLVLDEVFGSLDDTRRDNVVSLLQNLKHRFEQIILITHIESIHDAMDNCLWVAFDERTKTSSLVDRNALPELV